MTMTIVLSAAALKAVDLDGALPYIEFHAHRVYLKESNEHYRLLAFLASKLANANADGGALFVDTRTHLGSTAIALAHGALEGAGGASGARVVSYDTEDVIARFTTDIIGTDVSGVPTAKTHPRVETRLRDPSHTVELTETLLHADLVVLEPDAKTLERAVQIVRGLEAGGFRGVLVMDAIKLTREVAELWQSVCAPKKLDVSALAHWSGTGIALFDPTRVDVVVVT